jgi:membrane protein implicated in regulation of membrane protease activity
MQPEWWQWAVAGIVLILAELAVPAFVLVWFGLGALLVAALVWLAPATGLTAQLAVWLVVSVVLVFLWFRVFRPERHKSRFGMSVPELIGEIGLLVQDVAPFVRGEVRFQKPLLGTDTWPCIADEEIKAGERVKVIAVEGSLLKVGRGS